MQKKTRKFWEVLKTMKEFQKVLRSQITKLKLIILIKVCHWANTIVAKMQLCMITHLVFILNLSKKEFKAVKHIWINFTQIKSYLLTEMQTKWINNITLKTTSSQNFIETTNTKSSLMTMTLLKVCMTINKMQLLLLCLQEFQTEIAKTCRVLK